MEKEIKKMRLEVKTTYFNNKVANQLIVMSLFEDSVFYDDQSVYSEIVDNKLIYVGKTISNNFKIDYTIKKINSVNTFIEFSVTAIREPQTILNSVYHVIMSIETRE